MNNNLKGPVQGKIAKVPVVMQLEALECGAACLTMILAYYGKWVPLEQVRKDCGVSRDGSNALNILKAARSYGLAADAYMAEPGSVRKDGKFPCIIHWEFNHFVVLDGFRGNKVFLNDPARGRVVISEEEFDEKFTGVFMMFEPTEEFVPSGKKKSIFSFAAKRLHGARAAIIFALLVSVILQIYNLIEPAMKKVFLDWILPNQNASLMIPFILILYILAATHIILAWLQTVSNLRIQAKMDVVGNMTFMWKLLRLPMEFFSQRMAGDLLQRQSTNASIAGTLVNTVSPLILNAVMMVVYFIVMVRQSLLLTVIGVTCMFVNLLTSLNVSRKRINISRVQMRDAGKLAATTMSGIQMIETIKSSGAENGYFRKWSGLQASVNRERVNDAVLNARYGIIPMVVASAARLTVMFIGVYLTMKGQFTVGLITAFQEYLNSFMTPVSSLISAGQTILEMRTSMERVEDVMEYPDAAIFQQEGAAAEKVPGAAAEAGKEPAYQKLSGRIDIEHVTFGYSPLGTPLITDLNLHLEPGSKVALVGASGCGKSTIAKLVTGLYQPWSGQILFDGIPIEKIDRNVLTGSLAVVDQDIILFEDTIAGNIRMWDNTIEDFEVILAARDAGIHDDIMKREGGYRSRLTEGGKDLSGGQRQRMEIARVLAQDPTIIILDEATSALDAKTEYEVTKAISDRGITSIVVAHRLSTIRDCDEIIVLDNGHVVQRGTHEELYAREGLYRELVTSA